MLQRLARVPIDTFLLALLAVVALAALFPASGTVGDLLSIVTKVAIALLFFLYGARLSPTEAMHGCGIGGCICWCLPRLSSRSRSSDWPRALSSLSC